MKRFVFVAVLVFTVIGAFAMNAEAAMVWSNLNVAPFNPLGSLAFDLEGPMEFLRHGALTEPQAEEVINLIKEKKFERVTLERGRPLRAMLSRKKGEVHADTEGVDPQWKNIAKVDARLYRLKDGTEYLIVDECGNPVLADPISSIEREITKLIPIPVAAPIVRVLTDVGPEAVRTWRPNLWSWKNSAQEGRDILTQLWSGVRGKQSIDLHDQIMQAAADGKIRPHVASCESLKFEWFDIDQDAYLRDTIWVTMNEGGLAKRVEGRPSSISHGLYACGGSATLTVRIKPVWAKQDMSFGVTAPQGLSLRYPKGHTLWSCGPATAKDCTAKVLSPTISFQHAQRAGVTDLHFVVDD